MHMPPAATWARSAPAQDSVPLSERILLTLLFVAMLSSSVAFIEPSPHDAAVGLLSIACLTASVRFARITAVPVILLVLWNAAGVVALMHAYNNDKSEQYVITSVYLAVAATLFMCMFSTGDMRRLAAMRSGYIISAVIGAITGILGYFHLVPGYDNFILYDRAMGMFKDPNVFGPYLIWPALFVIARALTSGITLRDIVVVAILAAGIFFSFSRGAWVHFMVSGVLMMALLVLTAPTPRQRMRIVTLNVVAIGALALIVVAILSIGSVREMFLSRAQAVQGYDVGEGGRFELQIHALSALLDFPAGMGPMEFGRIYGLQQHNVYLQGFIVYGWLGGLSYILLVLSTIVFGIRTALIASPWQTYLITAYATFVGMAGEGIIIDTDHWRHFFLLLGLVWGLGAATIRYRANPYHGELGLIQRR